MKPVMQNRFGWPGGNCYAAALASIFELSIDDMPDIGVNQEDYWQRWNEWFRSKGMELLILTFPTNGEDYPGFHVVTGRSPRAIENDKGERALHAVVYYGMKPVHDPHPDGTFLDGPPLYMDFYYPLDPASFARWSMDERKA